MAKDNQVMVWVLIAIIAIAGVMLFKGKLNVPTESLFNIDTGCTSSEPLLFNGYTDAADEWLKSLNISVCTVSNGTIPNLSATNTTCVKSNEHGYYLYKATTDTAGEYDLIYLEKTSSCSAELATFYTGMNKEPEAITRNGRTVFKNQNKSTAISGITDFYLCNQYNNVFFSASEYYMEQYFNEFVACTEKKVFTGYTYKESETEGNTCILESKVDSSNPFTYTTKVQCLLETKLEEWGMNKTTFYVIVIAVAVILLYTAFEVGPNRGFIRKKRKSKKRKRR